MLHVHPLSPTPHPPLLASLLLSRHLLILRACRQDPKLLLDDVAALRPTFFAAVPRIFERIYMGMNHVNLIAEIKSPHSASDLSLQGFKWLF